MVVELSAESPARADGTHVAPRIRGWRRRDPLERSAASTAEMARRVTWQAPHSSPRSRSGTPNHRVYRRRRRKYGFRQPDPIASYRDDGFIVNHGGSVTEIHSQAAALIRIISGPRYEFGSATAAVEHEGDPLVVNTAGGAVTEFNASTGALVRILGGVRYGFDAPTRLPSSEPTSGSRTRRAVRLPIRMREPQPSSWPAPARSCGAYRPG
jgi:hypothetical protein